MLKNPRRRGLAAAVIVVAAAALGWTSLASGAGGSAPDRIVAKAVPGGKYGLKYVLSDDSVQAGGKLVIKDKTPGEPHTLSLVKPTLVPNKQFGKCFKPGHICNAVAFKWHKAPKTGNGAPKVNPVNAGKPGWDTQGDLTHKGDSVYYTPKKPAATRVVSAAAGTTLHFMCVIHPWMHGTIHVK